MMDVDVSEEAARKFYSWAILGVFILVLDSWLAFTDHDTLSHEYSKAARKHPVLVTAGTIYMVAHLYALLPQKIDILTTIGLGVKNKVKIKVT